MSLQSTRDQSRWGTAVTLLSLDRALPFYAPMGVPGTEPEQLLQLLREVIEANREAFARNPSRVPDLRGRLLEALERQFGRQAATSFEAWVLYGFVLAPRDMLPADVWWQVLLLARRQEARWTQLRLPTQISVAARLRLEAARDKRALDALHDQVDDRPLSAWDVEMYALHGFDMGDNDPAHRINLTVLKRAMLDYLRWLASALSERERAELLAGAEKVRRTTNAMDGMDPLEELDVVLKRHAYHPA